MPGNNGNEIVIKAYCLKKFNRLDTAITSLNETGKAQVVTLAEIRNELQKSNDIRELTNSIHQTLYGSEANTEEGLIYKHNDMKKKVDKIMRYIGIIAGVGAVIVFVIGFLSKLKII